MKWKIFCEESGDKRIPWIEGSSHYYIITAVLVRESDEQALIDTIELNKYKELRMKPPLEWKKLNSKQKRNDKIVSRFLRKIDDKGPHFLVAQVICNKHETYGLGLIDTNTFMNYLYGLLFKRITPFLSSTNSTAKLIIDRNTDDLAQESLRKYLSSVSTYLTNRPPRFSKPKWINPEEHAVLGLADFLSGVALRSLTDYYENVDENCKKCKNELGIYTCTTSNFSYYRSFEKVVDLNYDYTLPNWTWRGLLYHPMEFKNDYKHIFVPK